MVERPKVNVLRTLKCLREAVYKSDGSIKAVNCISEVALGLGLNADTDKSYAVISSRSGGLFNTVAIHYEPPGTAKRQAEERLVRYIEEVVQQREKALGVVVSDGLTFVYYDPYNGWVLRRNYIDRTSVIKLVEALRGLTRRSLYDLAEEFGVASAVAKKFTSMLYERLERSEEAREAYSKWLKTKKDDPAKRFLMPPRDELFEEIVKGYGLDGVTYMAVFALQTYVALLLKLLAAETLYVYSSGEEYGSFLSDLADGNVYRLLDDLERGTMFPKFANFLDGNSFSWYLNAFDEELAGAVADLAKRLANYEIATPQLVRARDLFQLLLGRGDEVEQMAEDALDRAGLGNVCREDPDKLLKTRVLDPVAGSGTVLLAYVNKLRQCENRLPITSVLLGNIVGYTQDQLMAIAARVNWYLAVADVLTFPGRVDIPIYLAGLQIPFNYFVSLSQR